MYFKLINRVLLGLLMLVPGLVKLFVFKPEGVTAMLDGLGFPAPIVFAWILIVLEIGSGALILANYRVKEVVWAPIVILAIAVILTNPWSTPMEINPSGLLFHLLAISNYLLLWAGSSKGMMSKK